MPHIGRKEYEKPFFRLDERFRAAPGRRAVGLTEFQPAGVGIAGLFVGGQRDVIGRTDPTAIVDVIGLHALVAQTRRLEAGEPAAFGAAAANRIVGVQAPGVIVHGGVDGAKESAEVWLL